HLAHLQPEGIFTHFSTADEGICGQDYTERQFEYFCSVIDYLQIRGINVGIRHCANSAARKRLAKAERFSRRRPLLPGWMKTRSPSIPAACPTTIRNLRPPCM
ncbi:MAG: alanine racemase, partial [Clostridia bacterium]|nr:alanine racemase [Clostridia bacterium]